MLKAIQSLIRQGLLDTSSQGVLIKSDQQASLPSAEDSPFTIGIQNIRGSQPPVPLDVHCDASQSINLTEVPETLINGSLNSRNSASLLNLSDELQGSLSKIHVTTIGKLVRTLGNRTRVPGLTPEIENSLLSEIWRGSANWHLELNQLQSNMLQSSSGSKEFIFDFFDNLRRFNSDKVIPSKEKGPFSSPSCLQAGWGLPEYKKGYDSNVRDAIHIAYLGCSVKGYPINEDTLFIIYADVATDWLKSDSVLRVAAAIIYDLESDSWFTKMCLRYIEALVREKYEAPLTKIPGYRLFIPKSKGFEASAQYYAELKPSLKFDAEKGHIVPRTISIQDWVHNIGGNAGYVLNMLFNGFTLRECAKSLNRSREELKNTIAFATSELPEFTEDQYIYFFQNYDHTLDDFKKITGEPAYTYHYLQTMHGADETKKRALLEALNDERVSATLKEAISREFNKQSLKLKQVSLSLRKSILRTIVKTNAATQSISLEDIQTLYSTYLKTNRLCDSSELMHSQGKFRKTIEGLDDVFVFTEGRDTTPRARFFYEATDLGPLYRYLRSGKYKDIECSTELLLNDKEASGLFGELGLNNPYELHYIIKQRCSRKIPELKSGRAPLITFGEGDRHAQILELIQVYSPISRNDLADEYYREYGVQQSTVLGTYLKEFAIYYRNGKYIYNEKGLNDEQRAFLQEELVQDYVSIHLIKERFRIRFPEASSTLISANNLKSLGYVENHELVVREGIDLGGVFNNLIRSTRSFSKSDKGFGEEVFNNPEFRKKIAIATRAFDIIEFEKDSYIHVDAFSDELGGNAKESFNDFVDEAVDFMQQDTPYTIKKLVDAGFTHDVIQLADSYGFDNTFCESLLESASRKSRLRKTTFQDRAIFCKTTKSFKISDLLAHIVERSTDLDVPGCADLDDICCTLEEEYGLDNISLSRVRRALIESDIEFIDRIGVAFASNESYENYKTKALDTLKTSQSTV